jgi:hypothetical protein
MSSASDRAERHATGWLRFCGQVFKSIFVPRIRIFSRRDYRTQPGVLTPGTDKKGTRPEGGCREAFSALDAERDPQRISAAPSGRALLSMCSGVETPGSVYSPFGTKNSIRSKYPFTFSKPHQFDGVRSLGVLRQVRIAPHDHGVGNTEMPKLPLTPPPTTGAGSIKIEPLISRGVGVKTS